MAVNVSFFLEALDQPAAPDVISNEYDDQANFELQPE